MPALEALTGIHEVIAVVTQPDRPAGRGKSLTSTPVKIAAQSHRLHIVEPLRLRGEFETWIAELTPDAFVVVSYGRILPRTLLEIPRLGAFNIHPSDLPLYRGATPMTATIKDGRAETAVCVILMDQGLDTGDIVVRRGVRIEALETGGHLHDRLAPIGAELVCEALAAAEKATLIRLPQSGLQPEAAVAATMTKPLHAPDLLIDWHWPASDIVNHVRAYAPQPAARADLAGERIKLLDVALDEAPREVDPASPSTAGDIVAIRDESAVVRCGRGYVAIRKLIPPSRGPQSGAVYARNRNAGSLQ